jgi:DNA-binding transcriptional MerR regulator
MEYGIEELATAAGVPVDTIRFYQSQGLLVRPRRAGRRAVYSQTHLSRLRRIRRLQRDGFPLGVIRRLLTRRSGRADAALLRVLSEERGPGNLSRAELAAEAGVPEELIAAVEGAGIVEPLRVAARARYGDIDAQMARAALTLLRAGFPLQDLLALAIGHAEHVRDLADRAIDLFDAHIRRDREGRARHPSHVVAAFRDLLPPVTALVAHHFQRTLVARAIARLERKGDREGLKHALEATTGGRLEITWR